MIKHFHSKTPNINESAYVDQSALVIGDVQLGEDVSIWPMAVLRGDINRIVIGHRSNIQDGSIIHVTHAGDFNPEGFPTLVGNEVVVGHRVILHGCQIKDNVLIGMGSIVMDGALINSNVLIGAGSLVPPGKELEAGHLWVGSPVRKVREITQQEYDFLRYSANYYVNLKNKYCAN